MHDDAYIFFIRMMMRIYGGDEVNMFYFYFRKYVFLHLIFIIKIRLSGVSLFLTLTGKYSNQYHFGAENLIHVGSQFSNYCNS